MTKEKNGSISCRWRTAACCDCSSADTSAELLLADEPTGNLDSKAARDVMEILSRMNKQRQVTTMMVTHDPYSASFSDRVVFIKRRQTLQ